MTKKSTEANLELAYAVTQIKTKSLTINESDEFITDTIDVLGQVALRIDVVPDFTAEITFEINSEFINNITKEILVSHLGVTKFKLINAQSIFSLDSSTLHMPDQLLVTLYAMAHTHARALLAADLKNSIFKDKLFIPIIDPKVILNQKQNA